MLLLWTLIFYQHSLKPMRYPNSHLSFLVHITIMVKSSKIEFDVPLLFSWVTSIL